MNNGLNMERGRLREPIKDPRMKKHFNTPEGRYLLREEESYHYPNGFLQPSSYQTYLSFLELPQTRIFNPQSPLLSANGRTEGNAGMLSPAQAGSPLQDENGMRSLRAHKSKRTPFQFLRNTGRSTERILLKDSNGAARNLSLSTDRRPSLKRGSLQPEGERACLVCNVGREVWFFQYEGLNPEMPSLEHHHKDSHIPVDVLHFEVQPTSHHFNTPIRCRERMDLLIGLQSGQCVMYDIVNKTRKDFNVMAAITASPVTCVRWVPGTLNQFLASHCNGTINVYHTARSDPPPSPGDKDVRRVPFHGFSVLHPKTKCNPTSRWRLGKEAITDFQFSPDCLHVAAVGRDGCLRLINYQTEKLIATLKSYFGAFLCVSWSPDGLYLLTGGEDDLVSLWSFEQKTLLARGEGHGSWVSAVSFDPWTCGEDVYRFGSVGLDQRLLLWDFSVNTLIKPKQVGSVRVLSAYWIKVISNCTPLMILQLRPSEAVNATVISTTLAGPMPYRQVPTLEPIANTVAHPAPLTALLFREDCLLTACQSGQIKIWARPQPAMEKLQTNESLCKLEETHTPPCDTVTSLPVTQDQSHPLSPSHVLASPPRDTNQYTPTLQDNIDILPPLPPSSEPTVLPANESITVLAGDGASKEDSLLSPPKAKVPGSLEEKEEDHEIGGLAFRIVSRSRRSDTHDGEGLTCADALETNETLEEWSANNTAFFKALAVNDGRGEMEDVQEEEEEEEGWREGPREGEGKGHVFPGVISSQSITVAPLSCQSSHTHLPDHALSNGLEATCISENEVYRVEQHSASCRGSEDNHGGMWFESTRKCNSTSNVESTQTETSRIIPSEQQTGEGHHTGSSPES